MKALARVVVTRKHKSYTGVNSAIPGARGKMINLLLVIFLFGDVPCDLSNVKYVPWLLKVGKHCSSILVGIIAWLMCTRHLSVRCNSTPWKSRARYTWWFLTTHVCAAAQWLGNTVLELVVTVSRNSLSGHFVAEESHALSLTANNSFPVCFIQTN